MIALIRRALRVLRYRRRWGAIAAVAAREADRATALHERKAILLQGRGPRPPRRRPS